MDIALRGGNTLSWGEKQLSPFCAVACGSTFQKFAIHVKPFKVLETLFYVTAAVRKRQYLARRRDTQMIVKDQEASFKGVYTDAIVCNIFRST